LNYNGKCTICGKKDSERFSSNPQIYLCDKHAEIWVVEYRKVFPCWETHARLITNDKWNKAFSNWSEKFLKEKVAFT